MEPQPIIQPIFPGNCMKKIGSREVGARPKFYYVDRLCYVYNFTEESLAAGEINVAVIFTT